MTALPTVTTRIAARRVLVIAPHPDDETLGAGGLLRQLANGGADVRVLVLSDGSGGDVEPVADPAAYARTRRAEIERAGAILGVRAIDHADLPDAALATRRAACAEAIRGALRQSPPDLVLVPSPHEQSDDHRIAFAALADVLAPLRPGDSLGDALGALRVLLYEVNSALDPDVLVDVTKERPVLEQAIGCYASQLARHGYRDAALGLRAFRTLSVGAGVALAEAYRSLSLDDFATRSEAELRALVGVPSEVVASPRGPLVSAIVRTRDRPALLAEALASIARSTYRAAEVVLVNDGGERPRVPADYPFPVLRIDWPESRGRAAAAEAGTAAARGHWLAFLDDDDLWAPDHLATLVAEAERTGARAVYGDAAATIWERDVSGTWRCRSRSVPYSRDFDPDFLLLDNYIPLHTLLFERSLKEEAGAFDLSLPVFEDWDLLIRLAAVAPFHHLRRVTCEYRHFAGGTQVFGHAPSEQPDFVAMKARVLEKHRDRIAPDALARAVVTMRAEAVESAAAAAQPSWVRLVADVRSKVRPLAARVPGLRPLARRIREVSARGRAAGTTFRNAGAAGLVERFGAERRATHPLGRDDITARTQAGDLASSSGANGEPSAPRRLHVGCGPHHLDGWWNVDREWGPGVDRVLDVRGGIPLRELDAVYAEHFLEHLTLDEALDFLVAVHGALAPGGRVRLSTPNLDWVHATHYRHDPGVSDEETLGLLFNRAFHGWGHRHLWNRALLQRALAAAGFTAVEWHAWGESDQAPFRGIERHPRSPDLPTEPHVLIVEATKGAPAPAALAELRALLRTIES